MVTCTALSTGLGSPALTPDGLAGTSQGEWCRLCTRFFTITFYYWNILYDRTHYIASHTIMSRKSSPRCQFLSLCHTLSPFSLIAIKLYLKIYIYILFSTRAVPTPNPYWQFTKLKISNWFLLFNLSLDKCLKFETDDWWNFTNIKNYLVLFCNLWF